MPPLVRGSTSSLKVLATCTTQFVLSYVRGLSKERESVLARAGRDAHSAWSLYFKGFPAKLALRKLRQLYQPFVEDPENIIEESMQLDNVMASMKTWFARHPLPRLPWKLDPEFVEIAREEPLDEHGDYMFVYVIDVLGEARDEDTYYVIDNKTSRAITEWYIKKFVNGAQFTGYIWAARRVKKDPTINRAYANVLAFRKLNMSYTKCTMPAHRKMMRADCWPDHVEMRILGPYERTEEQLRDWQRTALKLLKRFPYYFERYGGDKPLTQKDIDSLGIEGALHDACRFCEFEKWCSYGRNPRSLEGMFVRRSREGLRSGVWDDDDQ